MRFNKLFLAVTRRLTFLLPSLTVIVLLAITGCGDGKGPRGAVKGTVSVDGKPTSGVQLIFVPVGGTPEFQKIRPMGLTVNDGTFVLNTSGNGDGAPPGQYKVLLSWAAQSGADRLRGRYNNLDKTPFTVEIKSGSNDLPPFELKSQ